MSVTLVQTTAPQIQSIGYGLPQLSIKDRILSLIKEMQDPKVFSQQSLEEIAKWERKFNFNCLDQLSNEKARELASLDLCYLIYAVIRPQLCFPISTQDYKILYSFETSLKKILESTVPTKESASQFLTIYEKGVAKQSLLKENAMLVTQIFNEGNKQADEEALHLKTNNEKNLRDHKVALKNINANRKEACQEITSELESIEASTSALINDLENQVEKIAIAGNQLQKQQQSLETIQKGVIILSKGF